MTDLSGRPVAILVTEDDPGAFGLIRVHLRSAGLGYDSSEAFEPFPAQAQCEA